MRIRKFMFELTFSNGTRLPYIVPLCLKSFFLFNLLLLLQLKKLYVICWKDAKRLDFLHLPSKNMLCWKILIYFYFIHDLIVYRTLHDNIREIPSKAVVEFIWQVENLPFAHLPFCPFQNIFIPPCPLSSNVYVFYMFSNNVPHSETESILILDWSGLRCTHVWYVDLGFLNVLLNAVLCLEKARSFFFKRQKLRYWL